MEIDMEKNWNVDIDNWLAKLRSQALSELTKIVFALKESEEELDEIIFEIPYDKFEKEKFTGNIRSWLINLHKKKIIQVWTNPPYKKTKVGSISVGTPITDDKNILFDPTTQVELDSMKFDYLFKVLEKKQTQLANRESDNVQGTTQINELNKKISLQRIAKKIIKLHKFPKKQKAFLKALSDCNPHDTKMLKKDTSIDSKDLRSLKRDTKDKIKSYGLSKILVLKHIGGHGGFPVHFYQLEVDQQEYFRTYRNT